MFRLPLAIGFLLFSSLLMGQSPHGKDFAMECSECHTSDDWKVRIKSIRFNHDSTGFQLTGQHAEVNCRSCHSNLVFPRTPGECRDCHQDLHEGTLTPDCGHCHTTASWIVKDISRIHQESRFPLTGAHQVADCFACHKSGSLRRFDPIGIECQGCHLKDYQATTKPNHLTAGYSTDCIQCHSAGAAGWDARNINHEFFPLTEGHNISCTQCHTDGTYSKISKDCFNCHQDNYNTAKNPDHQQLGFATTCQDCHTTSLGWKPARYTDHDVKYFPIYSGSHSHAWNTCTQCHAQTDNYGVFTCIDCHEHSQSRMDNAHKETNGYQYNSNACFSCHPRGNTEGHFDHASTNFPLTGAHATTDCSQCHASGFAGTPTDCNACHASKFSSAQSPNHTAAGLPVNCETCHNTTAWKPTTFSHVTTGYALEGGHLRIVQCSDCHKGTVQNTPTECITCHRVQYDGAKDHKSQSYPTDCRMCHNADNWDNPNFNHSLTAFPLTGAHSSVACATCHTSGFTGTPTDCNACHASSFTSAQSPNHTAAGLPVHCETCHNTTAWKPSTFNHVTTGFALEGGHLRIVQCSDCHKGTVQNTPTECITCHRVQYDGAKDHKSQSYPTDCRMCHNADNWDNPNFNHSLTAFPLTGAHVTVACATCHTSGFTGTPTDCNACHASSFTSAQSPNHTAAGLPVHCETCHNTTAWKPSTFNHVTTGFALEGGHLRIVQCSDCHKGTVQNTPTECITCHQVQYDGAKDHKSQSYPTDCRMCHNADNWDNPNFNHSLTAFPLTGAHVTVACATCHTSGFTGTPTDCNACHASSFTSAQSPNHTAAGLPVHCETCHNTTAWKPSTFNHVTTGFALEGGHLRIVQCSDCHKGTVQNTPTECITCHQVQYDGAKDHKSQSYPTDCRMCHNADNWDNPNFNHSLTAFPLTGAHSSVACATCHTSGFTGTPTDCNACHASSFTSAQSPNHTAAGLPVHCETCHNTTAWKPSTFNHATTGFALQGSHLQIVQCSDCHKGSVQNTPNTCYGCHSANYNSTTNPNHTSAQFPKDCESCHNATAWKPATWNHDSQYFPIYSGHHQGRWTLCSECHTNSNDYSVFSCIDCHAHNKSTMDSEHQGRAGYSYNSIACLNCHPRG